ncbi:Rossmann-like and DUF2520 domain-containing protein [candidate division CSSED10-310 bacterium]|uniref:Rossmann-like and DUF2520 domain-containing protein n=1 Tax=candidate division CSSED10-310 bacterium TaxID=2855610 RepID=A0ABV6YWG9_UNCC1
MNHYQNHKISFIGVGRIGSLLASLLVTNGYKLCGFFDLEVAKCSRLQSKLGKGTIFADHRSLIRHSDVIFITTVDDQIEAVVNTVMRTAENLEGKFFLHTSGVLPSASMQPLRDQGAAIASFHPCVSVSAGSTNLKDVYFVMEGDHEALKLGAELAGVFQGEPLSIPASSKTSYHFGAVLVSNFMVTICHEVMVLYKQAGINQDVAAKLLVPLLKSTVQNIEQRGVEASLTGPVARGDRQTINRHLMVLPQLNSELALLSCQLYKVAINMAVSLGYINQHQGNLMLEDIHAVEKKGPGTE